jgi:integrase/recombinase XerC
MTMEIKTMSDETRELIVIDASEEAIQIDSYARNSALELAILAWLDAKSNKSGSVKTSAIYREYLAGFRAFLNQQAYDLNSDPQVIATLAQAWCGHSLRGKKVAPATFNQRRAVLSSFYAFAKKRGVLSSNPLELVDGLTTQEYRSARPLNKETVGKALINIPRESLSGARDYALLSILLTTGRRVNELVSLQVSDLAQEGDTLIITWRRTKGGKTMQDEIQPHIARVLIRYLEDWYKVSFSQIAQTYHADAPVWVCLGNRDKGKPLTNVGVSLICKKYLGTSKVHATRHTFAHLMEEAGAKVSEIQAKLGHNNLQTTGRYLAALNSAKNEHADKVAAMLKIGEE